MKDVQETPSLLSRLLSMLARLAVATIYLIALGVCKCRRPSMPRQDTLRRIAVAGTFHNPGWFLSHIKPLAKSGAAEVLVVAGESLPSVDRVRFVCPPPWISKVVGRACAKFLWTLFTGASARPDLYIGYHILPNAIIALIAGRLFGCPTCYQMTAGPMEIEGGGSGVRENMVLKRLGRPSPWLERLVWAIVREFDLVVVRGNRARRFLADHGITDSVAIIAGSVDTERFKTQATRSYDVIFVGRLVEVKQPLALVDIIASVARSIPSIRMALLGDGPLLEDVRGRIVQAGLTKNIELLGQRADVENFLSRSRVFILPSLSEGLSIALAEAMISGAVPIVANVGELGDLVQNGVNGYLVEPTDHEGFASRIRALLQDEESWGRLSQAAVQSGLAYNGLEQVSALWAMSFRRMLLRVQASSGVAPKDWKAWSSMKK